MGGVCDHETGRGKQELSRPPDQADGDAAAVAGDPGALIMTELTTSERYMLKWLAEEDGQYGECYGPTLDSLIAKGLAVVGAEQSGLDNCFIAKGRDIMYRTVSITDAGRAAL